MIALDIPETRIYPRSINIALDVEETGDFQFQAWERLNPPTFYFKVDCIYVARIAQRGLHIAMTCSSKELYRAHNLEQDIGRR